MTADPPLADVLAGFALGGALVSAEPVTGGHINRSWRCAIAGRDERVFLQRINTTVYRDPARLMENVAAITAHVTGVLARRGVPDAERRTLRILPTREGAPCLRHADTGSWWRAYRYVEGSRPLGRVGTPAQARTAAAAFGAFLEALDADGGVTLHETVPRFHDTPHRLAQLDDALRLDPRGRAAAVRAEADAILARRDGAGSLVALAASGEARGRAVHNDPKGTNVLLDEATGEALCVVDLDNAMPGIALHDFGDMVRALATRADEDERDLARVALEPDLLEALLDGWLPAVAPLLTDAEADHLVESGRILLLEQAARFLTDHVLGDPVYRTAREDHNLDRCRTQLRQLEDLERRRPGLEALARAAVRRHR